MVLRGILELVPPDAGDEAGRGGQAGEERIDDRGGSFARDSYGEGDALRGGGRLVERGGRRHAGGDVWCW